MKTNKLIILVLLSLGGFTWVLAQPQQTGGAAAVSTEEGATIARQGTSGGAVACNTCHGQKGEGLATGGFPRLAGEATFYMTKQLEDYANGVRESDVMAPIAKALTSAQRESVSAYYASLPVPPLKPAKKAKAAILKRGELLANTGDMKLYLQACNNCHGPGGRGVPPGIPALSGQHASYLAQQISAWQKGKRKSSPDQMLEIAKKLSEKDIEALGAYFESVKLKSLK